MSGPVDPLVTESSGELTARRALTPARLRAHLSAAELYFRYVALGGTASSVSMSGHCATGASVGPAEHDRVVLALNERFLELDSSERLPYGYGGTPE